MRNMISEKDIENLIGEMSPISSRAGAHALENSQKISWNKISHFIVTNDKNTMKDKKARDKIFKFNFRKLQWSLAILLLLGLGTGIVYNLHLPRKHIKLVSINLPAPTSLPTNTIIPKKEIRSIEDFKPIAAQKLQELTGASDKQIEDILKGIDSPETILKSPKSKVEYSKRIIQFYRKDNLPSESITAHTRSPLFDLSKPITVEYWSTSSGPKTVEKEIVTQGDTYLYINIQSPYQNIFYNTRNSPLTVTKTINTAPEVLLEDYESRTDFFQGPSPQFVGQILRYLILDIGERVELTNIYNENNFTYLKFSPKKRGPNEDYKIQIVKIDENNKIISLKTEVHDSKDQLTYTQEIVDNKFINKEDSIFDFDITSLPKEIIRKEETVTWEDCGGGLKSTVGCPK